MDKLPTEIWHRIFIQLDLLERIKCTLVCQTWWRILDKYSLLYNVEIHYDDAKCARFMDMIKQSPHRAAQVEELDLTTCLDFNFNKRTLINIFPNVRVLHVEWDQGTTDAVKSAPYFKEPIEITHSKSKIKVLKDVIYCELAHQLLISNLCGNLEELTLDFEEEEGISCRDVVTQLKNMPALKTLSLTSSRMGIDDLENIHTNIPTITTLNIHDFRLLDCEAPCNVAPNNSITTLNFFIHSVDGVETHIQLYQYMIKKYANIPNIDYCDDYLVYYESSDAKRIYLNGVLDWYRVMPLDKQDIAILGVPDDVDIFEVFDSKGCQFETIRAIECKGRTLTEYLAQSSQSRYIQKLDLSGTDICHLEFLKNMVALTTLTASFSKWDGFEWVDLTKYLNGCPATVTSFSIRCPFLQVDLFATHMNYIEELDISCEQITRDIGDVISTCFPKLVVLTLSGGLVENVNIVLSQPFQTATFHLARSVTYGFSFKSLNQMEHEYYRCDRKTKTRVLYDDIEFLQTLSFTTFTKKRLDLSDRIRVLPE